MASEILRRNPTSTGNRRVFTWAGWVKFNKLSTTANCIWYAASSGSSEFNISLVSSTGALNVYDYAPSAYQYQYVTSRLLRDFSNWFHLVVAVDTTQFREDDRFKIYINGSLYNGTYSTEVVVGGINYQTRMNTPGEINTIGQNISGGVDYDANCELSDMFMVDGQALTPDVFGFYKEGKGYVSAGSTQSTDFRPGQWVPKAPRTIKSEINRRGGFGVNGFYLPMNDSSNFGADFHCAPNSIIKLKGEDLPQPRNGAPTTTDAYVSQLRSDPYAANLVLAVPGIIGGQDSGYGDYSANIKGSGSNKTITAGGGVGVAVTASYYGSAIFFDGTDDYLTTNTSTDFQFGSSDFTVEAWVKYKSGNGADTPIVLDDTSTTYAPLIGYLNANLGYPHLYLSSTGSSWDIASGVAFGPVVNVDQWTHLAISRQGTNISLYRDGVGVGIITDVGSKSIYQNSNQVSLGFAQSNKYFDGHIQDLRVYKGVAKYKGGFDVPKPYTPVGIESWRAVPDTTANNFCTWNPLSASAGNSDVSFADGNLKLTSTVDSWPMRSATFGISSGKWYFESYAIDTTRFGVGWGSDNNLNTTTFATSNANSYLFWSDNPASKYELGTKTALNGSPAFTIGDITGIAIDFDAGKIWYSINGTWTNDNSGNVGNPSNGSNPQSTFTANIEMYPNAMLNLASYSTNFGQNPTFSGNTTAGTFTDSNGKGLFKYQPPSGFLALCEDNLPTPAIADPGDHFKTVLWTGDGNSGRSITGLGFKPDLVWLKDRSVNRWHSVFDSIRGAGYRLFTNDTGGDNFSSTSLTSFDDDGFSLGSLLTNNGSGETYVAWCWKAGGAAVSNTDGSITSQVSANQDAGFSIVSYTGNGTVGATVGHGLGKKPKFFITKNRDTAGLGWPTFSEELLGSNGYMYLNLTNAAATAGGISGPTSSVITLSGYNDNNKSGDRFIAYCWAEIEGFSKFGSYVGNGNADGPFVYCGFKPAWVMIKSSTLATNWYIFDNSRKSTNPITAVLFSNTSDIETDNAHDVDFLSNGFKVRQASGYGGNNSGATYIFVAFAESPFSYSNSK